MLTAALRQLRRACMPVTLNCVLCETDERNRKFLRESDEYKDDGCMGAQVYTFRHLEGNPNTTQCKYPSAE